MNMYGSIDTRPEFDSPVDAHDFIHDLLIPGWQLSYASPEARQRFEDWTMTDKAAHCVHCGRPALDADGKIIPASWVRLAPEIKPHCADCTNAEMRPE